MNRIPSRVHLTEYGDPGLHVRKRTIERHDAKNLTALVVHLMRLQLQSDYWPWLDSPSQCYRFSASECR